MRALVLLCLIPAIAMAQPIPPAGGSNCNKVSAACRASSFQLAAGNKLQLNYSTNTTWIQASATTAGMVLNSGVANSGTNVAYTFDTTATLTSGRFLLSLKTGGAAAVLTVDHAGSVVSLANLSAGNSVTTGGSGYFSPSGSSMYFTSSDTDNASAVAFDMYSSTLANAAAKLFQLNNNAVSQFYVDKDGNGFAAGAANPMPVVHAAQTTSPVAIEFAKTAATGGVLAVTFSTAFASAPTCTCVITAAVPVACGITTAANTTSVTFTAGAGTDVINWICIGAK